MSTRKIIGSECKVWQQTDRLATYNLPADGDYEGGDFITTTMLKRQATREAADTYLAYNVLNVCLGRWQENKQKAVENRCLRYFYKQSDCKKYVVELLVDRYA